MQGSQARQQEQLDLLLRASSPITESGISICPASLQPVDSILPLQPENKQHLQKNGTAMPPTKNQNCFQEAETTYSNCRHETTSPLLPSLPPSPSIACGAGWMVSSQSPQSSVTSSGTVPPLPAVEQRGIPTSKLPCNAGGNGEEERRDLNHRSPAASPRKANSSTSFRLSATGTAIEDLLTQLGRGLAIPSWPSPRYTSTVSIYATAPVDAQMEQDISATEASEYEDSREVLTHCRN